MLKHEAAENSRDHETHDEESREMTMRGHGREKTLRSKQRAPADWMMKERETLEVQPQEEQSERTTTATTSAALHEQQHQMPPHVQIFIPDRSRRIKIVPPKPPREKKRPSSKEEAQGNARSVDWCSRVQITGTSATRLRGRFGAREYRSDQQKSTRTDRETQ